MLWSLVAHPPQPDSSVVAVAQAAVMMMLIYGAWQRLEQLALWTVWASITMRAQVAHQPQAVTLLTMAQAITVGTINR